MLPRCPSQRDLDIFHAVAVEGRSQRQAAAEVRLSQPRIAQIVRRVRTWTGAAWPSQVGEQLPSVAVRAAWRVQQQRLAYLYHQALEAWRKSLEPQVTRKTVEANGALREERIAKTQCGRASLLAQAQRLCEAMAAVDGLDVHWQARHSPLKRTLSPQEQTEIVTLHEILADIRRRREEEAAEAAAHAEAGEEANAASSPSAGEPWSEPKAPAPKDILPIDYPHQHRSWDWRDEDFPQAEKTLAPRDPAPPASAAEASAAAEPSAREPEYATAQYEPTEYEAAEYEAAEYAAAEYEAAGGESGGEPAGGGAADPTAYHPLSPGRAEEAPGQGTAAGTVGGAAAAAGSCAAAAGPKSPAAEAEFIAPSAYRGSNSSPDPYGAAAAALTDRHRRDPRIIIWER